MDGRKNYGVGMDSIGVKDVSENVYHGVQSMRTAENLQITSLNTHLEIINSLAYIKKTAVIINCEIGLLERKTAEVVVQACDKVLEGRFRGDFIVGPIQGEVGTSLDTSANEVIVNRATEVLDGQKGDCFVVSLNDRVNCRQSANGVIPTAGRMTSLRLSKNLKPGLMRLHREFNHKTEEFNHVIKMERTQMQDAVLIRLRQEFEAYSVAVTRDIRRMDRATEETCTLNMGGTVIETGINADGTYPGRIVPSLAEVSNVEFVQAFDLIDATQNLDPSVAVSGAIKACAVTLSRIANDLRLMPSGPKAGFNEVNLPVRQNRSSVMPGKVNPATPKAVNQIAFNTIGNDPTIVMAAEAGQLELDASEPIIFYCMFQPIDTPAYAVRTFVDNCVLGITANEERCRPLVENSTGVITVLSPHVGHKKAADIPKETLQTGTSVRNITLQEGLLDEGELDHILDPARMTEPGISGEELLMKNNIDEKQYGTKRRGEVRGVDYVEVALGMHREDHGKLEMASKIPLAIEGELSIAYTPGVAVSCLKIKEDKSEAHIHTAKDNLMAVVTDGIIVLGLRDTSSKTTMPIMEGRAVLFKRFGDMDAVLIRLDTRGTEGVIEIVKRVALTFGGIDLEGISVSRCFGIGQRLERELNIPIFHDDQHGIVIVATAALTNALKLTGKQVDGIKVIVSGPGSVGTVIAEMLLSAGIKDLVACDEHGALCPDRKKMNGHKERLSLMANIRKGKGRLEDVTVDADVFVGVSATGVVPKGMVRTTKEDAVVFAMTNPVPEITYEEAKEAGTCVMAAGRSDCLNQISNVLVFPGLLCEALDCRARDITCGMKLMVTYGIAGPVSDEELGEEYTTPLTFDEHMAKAVTGAVKRAAARRDTMGRDAAKWNVVKPAVVKAAGEVKQGRE